MCEEEYASSFIPYLEYLSKVSMTVTYRQRQEYSPFVGASLSLARSLSLSLSPSRCVWFWPPLATQRRAATSRLQSLKEPLSRGIVSGLGHSRGAARLVKRTSAFVRERAECSQARGSAVTVLAVKD